jgi:hypothetical protein
LLQLAPRKRGADLARVAVEGRYPAGVYFDIHLGSFSAGYAPRGATAGVLTLGSPQLIVTSMHGDNWRPIELTSGAMIEIRNEAYSPRDHHDADFLLHFEIFDAVPPTARFPTVTHIAPTFQRCRFPPSS